MKTLKSPILVIFLISKALALKQDLLLKQWQPSALEHWIIDTISTVIGNTTTNYVFMVNFYLPTDIPIIALNTRKTPLPDLAKWYDFSVPILFYVRIYHMDEVYEVVDHLHSYRDFFDFGKLIIILPGRPTKEISEYFKKLFIFYVAFVEVSENDNFQVFDSNTKSVSKDFLATIRLIKIDRINVCYIENAPYTSIPESQGLEQALLDLVGRTLQINVTYTKQDLPPACRKNTTHGGPWDMLYNRSCDAVIGIYPCMKYFRDFDLALTHLTDSITVIVPKVPCPRYVGFVPISFFKMTIYILTYVSVKLILFWLSKNYLNVSPRQFFGDLKTRGSSFVTLTCSLAAIIIIAVYQARIYYSLVHTQERCGLQSLNDIWERKERIGIEAMLYRYDESIFNNVSLDVLKGLWTEDVDMENLDVTKPHILRRLKYDYLLPKRYMSANRETTFRKIETLMPVTISVFFYKAHYILPNVSAALLVIQQSALDNGLRAIEAEAKEAEAIAKETELLSYFTPIKLEEVVWLFWVHCVYGLLPCVLVFIGEILFAKYRGRLNI